METVLQNLPLLAALFVLTAACSVLAFRTRFTLIFAIAEGAATLFAFCFMMTAGASLEEILLVVSVFLLPSLVFTGKKGGEAK